MTILNDLTSKMCSQGHRQQNEVILMKQQSPQQQMVSHELERIWKELSMAHSTYYVGIQGYTGKTMCLWMIGCWGFKVSQWLHLKVKQSSKCWQPLTQQHSVTSQTQILSKSAIRTSNVMLYILHVSILHLENFMLVCCIKLLFVK